MTQFSPLVGVRMTGSGAATPERILTNDQLAQMVETNDDWIRSRTGIRERRLVSNSRESVASLATLAAQRAIAQAGITAEDLDLIILATSTTDDLFGTATQVQARLGAQRAVAFDLVAACSGFVFGLVTASQYIHTGAFRNVLLIGADVLSRWVDWGDRRTCILFGDGAGAVVLQAGDRNQILGWELRSDGQGHGLLNIAYSTEQQRFEPITMNGQEVYRFAVRCVPDVIAKALHRAEHAIGEVDWLILHQANQRIIDAVVDRLHLPPERAISNMATYGNTSAASIPIALAEWVDSGKILPGHLIVASGFGAGLSWGAVVWRWG
ncbi:MAG: ketoacyl-ACP synthase III [Oscillatoriales cyanobacterium SM2_2_1]|nr:ketoacyl-ACP synthase III [Oscillatoriales cyanobacterium SM2_2_1]